MCSQNCLSTEDCRYDKANCEYKCKTLSAAIWIPVVSIFAALLVVICVGYIILKKFPKCECIRRNPQTQNPQAKTIKNRENSERSYEIPYSVDIYNEYEQYDEGLYDQYKN